MKSWLLAIAVLTAFVARAPAAPVDMSTVACQDWLDAGEDEQLQMVAWLRGYLAGRSTGTLYDGATVRADATTLKRYCQGHMTVGVISAAGQWRR